MDNKAQISAELIIIMAALVAFSIFLITNLRSTAESASSKLKEKSTDLLKKIDEIANSS